MFFTNMCRVSRVLLCFSADFCLCLVFLGYFARIFCGFLLFPGGPTKMISMETKKEDEPSTQDEALKALLKSGAKLLISSAWQKGVVLWQSSLGACSLANSVGMGFSIHSHCESRGRSRPWRQFHDPHCGGCGEGHWCHRHRRDPHYDLLGWDFGPRNATILRVVRRTTRVESDDACAGLSSQEHANEDSSLKSSSQCP